MLSVFGVFFATLIPPAGLILSSFNIGLGIWFVVCFGAFLWLTFLTYRHHFYSIFGHFVLLLLSFFMDSGLSYYYFIILLF